MTRTTKTIQLIHCDICGADASTNSLRLSIDSNSWILDLCDLHRSEFDEVAAEWTTNAAPLAERRSRRQTEDDWVYLESLGFERHRGRKSSAELKALQQRR